jgi:DNA-directed RNA polymerase specialized sigma24 family protein
MPVRDDARYVEFVAANQQRLRRIAYLMTGDWQVAAAATQEALVRVYVEWPRAVRSGALATCARQSLFAAVAELSPAGTAAPAWADDPDTDRQVVVRALARLPLEQRQCLVLRFYDSLALDDCAAVLGCDTAEVRARTAEGLVALRRELSRQGFDDMPLFSQQLEGVR